MLLTSGRQVVDVNLVLQNYCNVRTEWLLKVMGSSFLENALIHLHLLTNLMNDSYDRQNNDHFQIFFCQLLAPAAS